MSSKRKGRYGVDGPYAWPIAFAAIVAMAAAGVSSQAAWLSGLAVVWAVCWVNGLHTTLRGKFMAWERLIDGLHLNGDEAVLDVGCGRGAVLLLAAQRITSGRAVGIDLWRKWDQSGNSEQAALDNAVREGVAGRIELHTADMTALPFDGETFDVILSNMAVHNVPDAAARALAIEEMTRVLRPGGRLLIADIKATRQYRKRLEFLGMDRVTRKSLGWRMWWCGPLLRTFLVSATKPQAKTCSETEFPRQVERARLG